LLIFKSPEISFNSHLSSNFKLYIKKDFESLSHYRWAFKQILIDNKDAE